VNMGGIAGMFGPWLVTGCRLVQHQPFDLGVFIDQIENERVTYSVAPPTVLTMMLQNETLLAGRDISSLRFLASGSAPLSSWMISGWERDRGVEVINFFGSNEGLCLVGDADSVPDPDDRAVCFPRFGAEGVHFRARHAPCTKVRLVDLDTGEDIQLAGRPGELRLSGPTVFPGYWGGVGSPFDDQGYYCSGDVFELAGDRLQYVRYVDRAKDLIIRGGMNIAPAEIEGVLAWHLLVAESVAVAWPDDRLGERICVFAALRPGTAPDALTLADVTEHFAAHQVAKFKWPERLEIVDALPRNPVGKVLKRDLREHLAAEGSGRV
jgi:acyl-CoA synthetase